MSGNCEEIGAQQKAQHLDQFLPLNDPRLARLVQVWPTLAEDVKQAILRLAQLVT